MTRRPAPVSVVTQPGGTQFTSLLEAKPCTSTIGSPSPFVEKGDLHARHWKNLAWLDHTIQPAVPPRPAQRRVQGEAQIGRRGDEIALLEIAIAARYGAGAG